VCSEALNWPCPGPITASITRNGGEWVYNGTPGVTAEFSGRHLELRGKREVDGYEDRSLNLSEDGQRMEGTRHVMTNAGWGDGCPCEGTSPVHYIKKQ
jgi:hypothetical protein